jgi:predicted O-methyltransferase YrrM
VLDEKVRAVLERLREEDAAEREQGLAQELRSRSVAPTTGRFLFSLVAPQNACEVLEIGGSRGYSSIWLAAGARILGGRILSLEHDPAKCGAWQRNIADAGLEEWAELVEGDARNTLAKVGGSFDVVFIDAWKDDYEWYFAEARTKLEPGGVVVADNVGTSETVKAYAQARQADPTVVSVTVPIGNGLEVTTILR